MNEYLKTGKKVNLSKLSQSAVPYQELLTKVEGEVVAVDDDHLEVALINNDFAEIEFIRIGILLNMCFAGSDALYKVVVEVEQIKEVSKLILVQRSKVQRIQRRQAFRVPVNKQLIYNVDKDNNFDLKQESLQKQGRRAEIIDISSIGLKMKVESLENIEVNTMLALSFDLPFLTEKEIKGKVVRVEEENMILGIEFVQLTEEIKQQLTRWIFKKEKELIEEKKQELKE